MPPVAKRTDTETGLPAAPTGGLPPSRDPAIAVSGLSFSVDGRALVDNVSLEFAAGEIAALVGHNGSGKSTLLKMLARQLPPAAGEIRYGLGSGRLADRRAFARAVAYLPQEMTAAAGMTLRELVACGRYPWHGALGRFSDEDRRKVADALALTHLETLADRMVETLSGGERQRAWIAMLMAQDAQCLLLDEPTSALDIAHQIELLGLVRRLAAERALSVVIVLHDINMAARFCDRIYALKGGRLIASGRPAQMMQRPMLEAIYGVPMDVMPHPALGTPLAYVL